MSIWSIGKRLGELFVVREEQRNIGPVLRAGRLVVFLDESGDLSFKKGGSEWFVVGGVVTKDVRGVGRVVRKVFQGFLKKEKKKRKGVLHATKETDGTRKKMLQGIAKHSESVCVAVVINKRNIGEQAQRDTHKMYCDFVVRLVDEAVQRSPDIVDQGLVVVASRRETNKYLNQIFCEQVREWWNREYGVIVDVVITPPFRERGLQVADVVSWAVFRKYAFGDGRWCELLGRNFHEVFWK